MKTGTGLFAGKISKNRLVCKNAVTLAYYGSCRLLVMGSCMRLMIGFGFTSDLLNQSQRFQVVFFSKVSVKLFLLSAVQSDYVIMLCPLNGMLA